jgi:hypothetical protein
MGHTPIPPRLPPPTRESFHLGRARSAYVEGRITVDRFEELADHVLRGGHLSRDLQPVVPPPPPPEPARPAEPTYR